MIKEFCENERYVKKKKAMINGMVRKKWRFCLHRSVLSVRKNN